VIVRDARRYGIRRRPVFPMSFFLSMAHAIVEDILVVVVSASLLWIVGFRIAWAVVVTAEVAAGLSIVINLRKDSEDRRRSRWKK